MSPTNSSIWVAPNALSKVCGPNGGRCTGKDWPNVIAPAVGIYANDYAPILTDIKNCNLPGVSFVIPYGTWSDHPDTKGTSSNPNADGGPSWVTAIVNAIGGYPTGVNNCGYWANTAILITWDDWGGFYDHVNPSSTAGGPGQGYADSSGQQYVFGFRVPLLVVSPYSKQGYISGPAPPAPPNCAHGNSYCHDFGSILGFIEKVWNQPDIGGLNYRFADYWVPDGPHGGCSQATCPYPLADFFNFSAQPIPFAPILGAKYPPACFHNPNQTGCWPGFTPQDPDDDGVNAQ